MLLRILAIEPDVDPQKDWQGNRHKKTSGKQPVPTGEIQECRDKSKQIHGSQQYNTYDGRNLLRCLLFLSGLLIGRIVYRLIHGIPRLSNSLFIYRENTIIIAMFAENVNKKFKIRETPEIALQHFRRLL